MIPSYFEIEILAYRPLRRWLALKGQILRMILQEVYFEVLSVPILDLNLIRLSVVCEHNRFVDYKKDLAKLYLNTI